PPKGGRKHPQQEFLQVDTTNILFVCGGAFNGIEEIVEKRLGENTLGFTGKIKSKKERNIGDILNAVQPEDLLKFGLIPELIGRLPVIASLTELSEEALVKILVEPKNALVKQYQKMFAFENVKLRFTDGSLRAIARETMKRKSGARGLRSIMEDIMLDIMYEIPSQPDIKECIVNKEVMLRNEKPLILYEKETKSA
ncbi:MAG: AAA family ATPase, partial [Deltaproteobacteria bacterium]|nr:AAA family ATPase [Deltaproteobacteria bacterium]